MSGPPSGKGDGDGLGSGGGSGSGSGSGMTGGAGNAAASPGTRHPEAERLSAWISGDLSERETAVVRTHVEGCAVCVEAAAGLRDQVIAARTLGHPEPPPTLWSAIEGALEKEAPRAGWRRWSWPAGLTGALAGATAVAALTWGLARWQGGEPRPTQAAHPSAGRAAGHRAPGGAADPLLAEAERELEQAALSYERAVDRLRKLVEREQLLWDPETRVRVAERLARLDDAVAHSRAVVRRDPGDSAGADLLFSAYQRQIAFLAEVVHRGSPASREGLP